MKGRREWGARKGREGARLKEERRGPFCEGEGALLGLSSKLLCSLSFELKSNLNSS